jgi:hypothetical protein
MAVRLTQPVLRNIDAAVLCWLATISPDGFPNVSPKEIFCAEGDEAILIAHILSPTSVANLRASPKACISFVDVFRQEGFKLVGMAHVADPDDPRFSAWAAPLAVMAGPAFPIKAAIRFVPDKIARILPPSRSLLPERGRAEELAATYRTYGVRPIE